MQLHGRQTTSTVVTKAIDQIAIDGQRQSDAEFTRHQQLLECRVIGVLKIGHDRADPRRLVCQDRVVAFIGEGTQQRQILACKVSLLHLQHAGDSAEVDHLRIEENLHADLIQIGQLVALWVDFPVVGIALSQQMVAGLPFRHPPGGHDGSIRIEVVGLLFEDGVGGHINDPRRQVRLQIVAGCEETRPLEDEGPLIPLERQIHQRQRIGL